MNINEEQLCKILDCFKKTIPLAIEENKAIKETIINLSASSSINADTFLTNSNKTLNLFHIRFFKSFKKEPEIHLHMISESKQEVLKNLKSDFQKLFYEFETFSINELVRVGDKPIVWKK